MSAALPQVNPSPFDAIAADYDRVFSHAQIGQAQRSVVWKELEKSFRRGDCVLEIGCGTGVDACFLAERGIEVVACDSSPRMIAVTAHKVAVKGLKLVVRPRLLAAEQIGQLRNSGPFDGAFSNFGALNCLRDLAPFVEDLGAFLKPGAPLLLCLMGPFCLWEAVWYLAQGNTQKAFRRVRQEKVIAQIAKGSPVEVYYPSVGSLKRTFAPHFRLQAIKGVGVLVPPSYMESWVGRFPRLFQFSVRADRWLGRIAGIRLLADHILLKFERKHA
jgi:SAM-dependent methyltransferase